MEEYNILDKFFSYREDEFVEEIGKDINVLKNRVKDIKREEINKIINSIPKENEDLKNKLVSGIDDLIADYNIMLAYYNKKYYKQGFRDATNLIKVCK